MGSDYRPDRHPTSSTKRAKNLKLLCALALVTLLASPAYSQYVETSIKLPDTLGPLGGPYHLAWDENPAHPRLYIGGESDSGGVIVAEAITCKRLARVRTGPVKALYFVPPARKLYVAGLNIDSVLVVDCATNQVTSAINAAGVVPVMQYNVRNDRLYCGGDSITVIDCDEDSVVHTIAVAASSFAYDSATNKLYAGSNGPLAVVDCASDSVVAFLSEVSAATALCLNPTARKVYATTIHTLFAIRVAGDSIVAQVAFDSLKPLLACDPVRNRVYCTYHRNDWGHWSSIDCSADTVLLSCLTSYPLTFLACNSSRDMLYVFLRTACDEVVMYNATTGEFLSSILLDGVPRGGGWSQTLGRLYCLPNSDGTGYSLCLLSSIDGAGDSIAGVVPLTVRAEHIALDTAHNRLYFSYGSTACGCVGTIDCAQNVVTSYVYGGASPYEICYNPNNNRLYWRSGGRSMTVYDCSTDTKVRTLSASGDVGGMRVHPGLNKLYVFSYVNGVGSAIDVVDCDADSVTGVIATDCEYFTELLLVPEDNTLWCLGPWSVAVIDCLGDSIVAVAPDTFGTLSDACACPEARRIYVGESECAWSVNMDKPGEVDALHARMPGFSDMRFLNIPGAHKVYWTANYSPTSARLFVIDTKTSTLVDSLWLNRNVSDMCLDHTGRYVYCVPRSSFDTTATVLDAWGDSVVSRFMLPPMIVAEKDALAANRATNRIYVTQHDEYTHGNEIPVIRDSIVVGLVEQGAATISVRSGEPTLLRRGTPLQVSTDAELWDATGRRAAVLKSGPNDISLLAPGVYFIRQGLGTRGEGLGKTRKVVVTR
jgi:DNA-binding beta-propeller fold protein YncE